MDIEFYVKDERMLSKGFNENSLDKAKIEELGNAIATKTRNKIYQKYDKDYEKTSQEYKNNWIKNVRKSEAIEDTYRVSLLYCRVMSSKYIKSKGWDTDKDMKAEIRKYNSLEDVKFDLEGWKNQE